MNIIIEQLMERLGEIIPKEKLEEVETVVREELESFDPSCFLKKECINILDIYTGMMPRPKAEEYLRKVAKNFGDLNKEGYEIFFAPRCHDGPASNVAYAEKGKVNIIDVYTGMLKDDRAEDFIERVRRNCKPLEDKGYDLIFRPKSKFEMDEEEKADN